MCDNEKTEDRLNGKRYEILNGDSAEVLRTLPDACVDMIVTSPPYFNLRVYGSGEKEIGRELTPPEYVERLKEVFHEAHRVLKDTGTLWLNLGDSYNGNKRGNTEIYKNKRVSDANVEIDKKCWDGLPEKSLLGMPWRVAFALQDDGWVLRQDIIWQKINSLPCSCTDRCSSSHEYIFLFSKKPRGYYFDYESIMEPALSDGMEDTKSDSEDGAQSLFADGELPEAERKQMPKFGGTKYPNSDCGADATYSGKEWKPRYKNMDESKGQTAHSFHKRRAEGLKDETYMVRRKRDVWAIPIKGFSGAHFATFPEKLVEPCILAGCPVGGIVLDPFNGAGTSGVVALKNHRRYIGIELNPKFIEIARKRIDAETAQDDFLDKLDGSRSAAEVVAENEEQDEGEAS